MPKTMKQPPIGHFLQRRSGAGYVLSHGVFWRKPAIEEFEKDPFYSSEKIVEVIKPAGANNPENQFIEFDAYSSESIIADFIRVVDNETALTFCNSYGLPQYCNGKFVDESKQPYAYFEGNEVISVIREAHFLRTCQIIINAYSRGTDAESVKYFESKFETKISSLFGDDTMFVFLERETKYETKFVGIRDYGFSKNEALDGAMQFLRKTVEVKMRASGGALTLQPRQRGRGSKMRLQAFVVPDDLLGVMWHRFTDGAGTRETIVECERCGQWFRALRADARMCSAKCRQRSSRGGFSKPRIRRILPAS